MIDIRQLTTLIDTINDRKAGKSIILVDLNNEAVFLFRLLNAGECVHLKKDVFENWFGFCKLNNGKGQEWNAVCSQAAGSLSKTVPVLGPKHGYYMYSCRGGVIWDDLIALAKEDRENSRKVLDSL